MLPFRRPQKPLFYFNFCFETKLFRIGYLICASIPFAFIMWQGSGIFTFTLVSYFFFFFKPKQRSWDVITFSRQHSKVIVSPFAKAHTQTFFFAFLLYDCKSLSKYNVFNFVGHFISSDTSALHPFHLM